MSNMLAMFAYRPAGLRDWFPKRTRPLAERGQGIHRKGSDSMSGVAAGGQVGRRDRRVGGSSSDAGRAGGDEGRAANPDDIVIGAQAGPDRKDQGGHLRVRLEAVRDLDLAARLD